MTRREYEEKSFEELVEKLKKETIITTYDELKNFAKENIDNDRLFLAIHILKALNDDAADYYEYDFNMGTLETPSGINKKEDIEHLIND